MKLIPLAIAAAAGLTMAIQGSLNAALGKVIGLWEATLVVHALGVAAALLFFLRLGDGQLAQITRAPWYTLLGGILSVLIIYGVATSIPKLGVATATTAIIVGQTLTALFIDHLGCFGLDKVPFTWLKLLGVVFLAAGAWLLLAKSVSS